MCRSPTNAAIAAPSTPGSSAVTVDDRPLEHVGLDLRPGGDARGAAAEPHLVDREAGRALGAAEHDAVEERHAFERRPDQIAGTVLARQAEERGAQVRIPERHALARQIGEEQQRPRVARLPSARATRGAISSGASAPITVPSQVSTSAPFCPGPPIWCRSSPHCTSIRPVAFDRLAGSSRRRSRSCPTRCRRGPRPARPCRPRPTRCRARPSRRAGRRAR